MLQKGTYSLWSKSTEQGLPVDKAQGGQSGPHIHPFILCQTANKDFFGIFFVSTAAQNFEVVTFEEYDQVVLNYATLGGDIEFYVIIGDTPNAIIAKYHALIGYSMVPPLYALGFF